MHYPLALKRAPDWDWERFGKIRSWPKQGQNETKEGEGMRRAAVGILGLVLCSTAQAESWTGTLYRYQTEGIVPHYTRFFLRGFRPNTEGFTCRTRRDGVECGRYREIDDDLGFAETMILRRRGVSRALSSGYFKGQRIGGIYFSGRLRYRR